MRFSKFRFLSIALVMSVLVPAAADAQRLVVGSVDGASEEAGVATLLLRSMFHGGQRPAVGRDELGRALDRNPTARSSTLGVSPTGADAVLKDVGADRLLVGELKLGQKTTLALKLYGPGGTLLAAHSVEAVGVDLVHLVADAATKLGKNGGIEPSTIDASLGELRPFGRALRSLDGGNARAAAKVLEVAQPGVVARVSAAKEVADAIWRDASLPADLRMIAALAAGEKQEALKLGRADTTKSVAVKAQEARVDLALGDAKGAAKAVSKSSPLDAMRLVRAQMAIAKHKPADAAKDLEPLLHETPPDAATLAWIATLPPGALDKKTEALAIDAAQRAGSGAPGVASQIGVRAARGGDRTNEAIGLVAPEDLRPTDLSDVDKMLTEGSATPPAAAKRLEAAAQRARAPELADVDEVKGVAVTPVAKPPRDVPPVNGEEAPIAAALEPALATLLPAEHHGGAVGVYALPSPPSLWALLWPQTKSLAPALAHDLALPAFDLDVAVKQTSQRDVPDEGTLGTMTGHGTPEAVDYLLFYRSVIDGTSAIVTLSLWDVKEKKLFESHAVLPALSSGLGKPSPILIGIGAAIVLSLLVLSLIVILSVGEVSVRYKSDPAAEHEAIVVFVSKEMQPPAIDDVQEFHDRARAGKRKKSRLRADNAESLTVFSRVPVGKFWVHVYGTHVMKGELRAMPSQSKSIEVKRKSMQTVAFDLAPERTEFRILVSDGGPVAGAKISIDDRSSPPVLTDAEGRCKLQLAKGRRLVHLVARDVETTRTLDVVSTKPQILDFDLVRERLRGGIALSDDEHPMGRHSTTPAGAPAASKSNAEATLDHPLPPHAATTEDDGIAVPAGWKPWTPE